MENQKLKNLENDLLSISGFISEEFIKLIRSNNGVIDISNEDFKRARLSLINSDPEAKENEGKAVLSFTATEQGIKKKLQKLFEKGEVTKDEVELLNEKIEDTKSKLNNQLSTNEGVKELVESRIENQLIEKSVNLFVQDQNTGQIKGMIPSDKNKLVESLREYIKIPAKLKQSILSGDMDCEKEVIKSIGEQVNESFGKKVNDNVYVFDKSKLENTNELSKMQSKINNKLEAFNIIEDSIKKFRRSSNRTIEESTKQKIRDEMLPKLSALGKNFLDEKKESISSDIVKELDKSNRFGFLMNFSPFRSFINWVTGYNVSTEQLKNASELITEKSKIFSYELFKTKVFELNLKDSDIKDRLNHFYKETGRNEILDSKSKIPTNKEIAELRNQDADLFDKIFSSLSSKVVSPALQNSNKSFVERTLHTAKAKDGLTR